jgi:hypothetical protein
LKLTFLLYLDPSSETALDNKNLMSDPLPIALCVSIRKIPKPLSEFGVELDHLMNEMAKQLGLI